MMKTKNKYRYKIRVIAAVVIIAAIAFFVAGRQVYANEWVQVYYEEEPLPLDEDWTFRDPGGVSQWRRDFVDSVASGRSIRIIIQDGPLLVSRTSMVFMFRNRSILPSHYGFEMELAHYVNGAWEPVPHTPSDSFRLPLGEGISLFGRSRNINTVWFDFMYGALPTGRYMFIRNHHRNTFTGTRNYEHLVFEFVITENTPMYLNFSMPRIVAHAIFYETVRLCTFIAVWITLRKLIKERFLAARNKID